MGNTGRYGDIFHEIDGSWASHDHVRHWMYKNIYDTLNEKVRFSEGTPTLMEFGCREPTSAVIRIFDFVQKGNLNAKCCDYPAVDIEGTPFGTEEFDITVADQVLEHVQRPWLGAAELYRITKTGGICVVATPIILHVHPNPLDCWRIMPDGYKVLFPEDKWEYLTFKMWGDKELVAWECLSPVTRGFTGDWLSVKDAFRTIPNYSDHTDGQWPVVIWAVLRKK